MSAPATIDQLSIEEVQRDLEAIRARADDDEVAHGLEDALYIKVLSAIDAGSPIAAELAGYALQARRIECSRWCS